MPSGISGIYGVTIAVDIRLLVQVGVPADKPPHLRVVEPTPHQRQPRVPLRPVAARRPELVRAGTRSGTSDGLPEGGERQAGRHCLAAVRHRPLGTQPGEQRRLPVFADERVSAGYRCSSEPLLLPSGRDHISR